jgi:hypothetical protein
VKTKLLLVLLVAALVSAVAYAAKAPVNADEPVTMTKGMYADLLCMAASEFDPGKGGIQFTYDPASDAIQVTYLSPTQSPGSVSNPAKFSANCKLEAKERANKKLNSMLPNLQRHVSPAVSTAFSGF